MHTCMQRLVCCITMAAATGALKPCLATIGTQRAHSRRQFHAWSKCALSAKLQVHTAASDEQRPTERPHGNKVELSKPLIATKNVPQKRRPVRDVRGVSVMYQQSATEIHRRKKGDSAANPVKSAFPAFISATSGGSVVASMSATERHRQKRRAEREQSQLDARGVAKTNPSSLRLPVIPDDHDTFDEDVDERTQEYETVVETSTTRTTTKEESGGISVVSVRTVIMTFAGVSTVVLIVSLLPL